MRVPLGSIRRSSAVTGTVAILALLGFAHARILELGRDYTGPLIVVDHLFNVFAVLALLAICTGAGRLALRRVGADHPRPIDSLLFSVATGVALVAAFFLLLGAVGLLSAPAVLASLVVLTAVSSRELRRLPRLAADAFLTPWREREDTSFLALALGVTTAAMAFMTLFALVPPTDWDGLMYHLDVPAEFLEAGRIFLPADNPHVAHVGVIHMLYIALLAVSSSAGPAVLNAAFALLLGLAMYSFCSRLLNVRAGLLGLALLWGTTTIMFVAASPRVEVALAFFLFLAHYALIIGLIEPQADAGASYGLAALLLGTAIGIKLSAVPYAAALAPLAVWVAVRRGKVPGGPARQVLVFGALSAGAALPWLVKNWLLMGAPFYPFFAEPRLAPWLASLFGGSAWPAQVSPDVSQLVWEFRAPFNLYHAFFSPGQLTIEPEGRYYYLSPALLALPLALFYVRKRALTWLLIPALVYLVLVLLVLPSPNLRYLVPAIPPLTVGVAYSALRVAGRLLSPTPRRLLLISLALLALVPSGLGARWRITRSRAVPHLVGAASANEYMASWVGSAYVKVLELANGTLDRESRILMLFEARGYHFETPVIQDNTLDNWPLLEAALPPGTCLPTSLGVTHVLVGMGSLRYYATTGGLTPEQIEWDEFKDLADRCLEVIYGDALLILFRVKKTQG